MSSTFCASIVDNFFLVAFCPPDHRETSHYNYASVADPGSRMGKNSGSGSAMNNPDHISVGLDIIFWVKIFKFFDADPGSGMEKNRIRDEKNSDPG